MSVELYQQYKREYDALPFTGRFMPYSWGSLPDLLPGLWLPYGLMFEEFARELANVINAFTLNVQRLATWAIVTAPFSDQQKMEAAHEFVDTLATNAVNAPYAMRSRFFFAAAHLCHQANRLKCLPWADDLPLDRKIDPSVANRRGAPWPLQGTQVLHRGSCRERDRVYDAFEAFQGLVREQENAIRAS